MRVQLMFGLGGGVFVDGGLGAELRVMGQVSDGVAVGGGLGVGNNLQEHLNENHGHPEWLFTTKGIGKFNPGEFDWLAVDTGLGLVFTDTGILALTVESGALFGYEDELGGDDSAVRGMIYGGPIVAASIPLLPGAPALTVDRVHVRDKRAANVTTVKATGVEVQPTVFIGATAGGGFESDDPENLGGTVEAAMAWAFSDLDEAVLFSLSGGFGATAPAD